MTSAKHRTKLKIARTIANSATCPRASVGALVVVDDRIVSTGYNGAPRSADHCKKVGCLIVERDGVPHCARAVHAELNALLNAAYHGVAVKGGTLYCTHEPCFECRKAAINAGIEAFYFSKAYTPESELKLVRDVFRDERWHDAVVWEKL